MPVAAGIQILCSASLKSRLRISLRIQFDQLHTIIGNCCQLRLCHIFLFPKFSDDRTRHILIHVDFLLSKNRIALTKERLNLRRVDYVLGRETILVDLDHTGFRGKSLTQQTISLLQLIL